MAKLTLSIKEDVIKRAKSFARKSGRSLSDIIETYLVRITESETDQVDQELLEVLGIIQLPEDYNEKKEIRKILSNKHL